MVRSHVRRPPGAVRSPFGSARLGLVLPGLALVVSIGLTAPIHAQPPASGKPAEAALQTWVKQLSDDSFGLRERASAELIKAGMPAIAAIEKSLDADNPEAASRAVQILNHFALSPDVPLETAASDMLGRLALGKGPAAREARQQVARLAARREERARARLTSAGMIAHVHSPTGEGMTVYGVEFNDQWAGTADDLAQLRWLINVQQVTITFQQADDSWMEHLGALPGLAYLSIKRTKISDQGIRKLRPETQPLQTLELKYVDVTDAIIDHLQQIRSLSRVRLFGTNITVEGAQTLQQKLALADVDHRDGAFLGVSCSSHPLGCLITLVSDDTAADQVGIERGDVVVEYAGNSVADFDSLTKWISRNKVGDEVRILFARQVEVYEFELAKAGGKKSGVEAKPHKIGLQVAKVTSESPLLARVREGDIIFRVNDTRVSTLAELDAELAKSEPDADVRVYVARGGEFFDRVAKLGEWE